MRPLIEAMLTRLALTPRNPDSVLAACQAVQAKFNRLGVTLPNWPAMARDNDNIAVCPRSVSLLVRCQPSLLMTYVPARTFGDGNCLFRAVSRCLYGYEDAHLVLRLMTAVEVGLHQDLYAADSHTRHELLRSPLVACPALVNIFQELSTPGTQSCVVAMIALSSLLGVSIESVYPAGLSDVPSPYSAVIAGRSDCGDRRMAILWSTLDAVPSTGKARKARINH
jgi:hypothetical protein